MVGGYSLWIGRRVEIVERETNTPFPISVQYHPLFFSYLRIFRLFLCGKLLYFSPWRKKILYACTYTHLFIPPGRKFTYVSSQRIAAAVAVRCAVLCTRRGQRDSTGKKGKQTDQSIFSYRALATHKEEGGFSYNYERKNLLLFFFFLNCIHFFWYFFLVAF